MELLTRLAEDPSTGWSMGMFGAVGEFTRDANDPCTIEITASAIEILSARGGLRVERKVGPRVIAYEALESNRRTWSNAIAWSMPRPTTELEAVIHCLGADSHSLASEERRGMLFDLGVGIGTVRMCVRATEARQIRALRSFEGRPLLGPSGLDAWNALCELSPTRVILSPLGRLEVYSRIPRADEHTPSGPHTHLIQKLVARRLSHSANTPVPRALQPVLTAHPPSPWYRAGAADRCSTFDHVADAAFSRITAIHGLADDRRLRGMLERAIHSGTPQSDFTMPTTRRGRAQLIICLMRLAEEGNHAASRWLSSYGAGRRSFAGPSEAAPHPVRLH